MPTVIARLHSSHLFGSPSSRHPTTCTADDYCHHMSGTFAVLFVVGVLVFIAVVAFFVLFPFGRTSGGVRVRRSKSVRF